MSRDSRTLEQITSRSPPTQNAMRIAREATGTRAWIAARCGEPIREGVDAAAPAAR